jgi:hypothetical protein
MSRAMRTAIVALFGLCVANSPANEDRVWRTKAGATAQASFVKEANGIGTLRKVNGATVQVSRASLSAEDEAYLVKLFYVPKTVTVAFAPTPFQGRILFMEATDKSTDQNSRLKNLRTGKSATDAKAPAIQQVDTVCFRVKSEITGEWQDDSTWSILSVEDVGQALAGNAQWADEKRKTDGRFIRVVFKLANNTKDEKYVNVPSLMDSKERKVNILDDSRRFIAEHTDPHLDKLPPGFARTYCAIYEMPGDSHGLRLMVPTLASYRYSDDGPFMPVGEKAVVLEIPGAR